MTQTGAPPPTYSMTRKIRFGHTDPAGIVYYPNYFDMFNGVVEDFFDECVGASFQRMSAEERVVTPLRHVECDFNAPSRIGDRLLLALTLVALGRSSVTLTIERPCWRSSGLPWRSGLEDGVEDGEEAAHAGDDGDLLWPPACDELGVVGLEDGVPPYGR
jgi:YbgC/YbaW family acyl-CoA thioester hydrolase